MSIIIQFLLSRWRALVAWGRKRRGTGVPGVEGGGESQVSEPPGVTTISYDGFGLAISRDGRPWGHFSATPSGDLSHLCSLLSYEAIQVTRLRIVDA